MPKQKKALLAAIDIAGSQSELARSLSKVLAAHPYPPMRKRRVTQPNISKWVAKGYAPVDMCVAIEVATGISRHELRPDAFYAPPKVRQAILGLEVCA